jgi:hypothetical protein
MDVASVAQGLLEVVLTIHKMVEELQDLQEDINEFKKTLTLLATIVEQCKTDSKVNVNLIDGIFQDAKGWVDEVQALQGGRSAIKKFITVRMRRKRFIQLQSIVLNRIHLLHTAFITSPNLSNNALRFISNKDARDMWQHHVGSKQMMIAWLDFFEALEQQLGRRIEKQTKDLLKYLLDEESTGHVSVYRFEAFTKAFGPPAKAVSEAEELLNQSWFHGYLSGEESKTLLSNQRPGTFLVRFSKSRPGAYSIDGVPSPGNVLMTLVNRTANNSFQLDGVEYDTIAQLVEANRHKLLTPYCHKLMGHPAFFGNITFEETEELLKGHPIGTYLIRISSSPGCFVVGYVARDAKTYQIKINASDHRRFEVEKVTFESLFDVLAHYQNVWSIPCPSFSKDAIITTPPEESPSTANLTSTVKGQSSPSTPTQRDSLKGQSSSTSTLTKPPPNAQPQQPLGEREYSTSFSGYSNRIAESSNIRNSNNREYAVAVAQAPSSNSPSSSRQSVDKMPTSPPTTPEPIIYAKDLSAYVGIDPSTPRTASRENSTGALSPSGSSEYATSVHPLSSKGSGEYATSVDLPTTLSKNSGEYALSPLSPRQPAQAKTTNTTSHYTTGVL